MTDFTDLITDNITGDASMKIALTDTISDATYMQARAWIGDASDVLTAYTEGLDAEAEGTEAAITAANDYTDGYAVLSRYSQAAAINNEANTVGICVGGIAGEEETEVIASSCWTAETTWDN